MTSYKTLYKNQLDFNNFKYYTDFKCPKCQSRIFLQGQELLCDSSKCNYDLEVLELFSRYAESNKYEKFV